MDCSGNDEDSRKTWDKQILTFQDELNDVQCTVSFVATNKFLKESIKKIMTCVVYCFICCNKVPKRYQENHDNTPSIEEKALFWTLSVLNIILIT